MCYDMFVTKSKDGYFTLIFLETETSVALFLDHSSLGMSGSDFELSAVDKPHTIPKVEETVYVCSEVEELGQVCLCCCYRVKELGHVCL